MGGGNKTPKILKNKKDNIQGKYSKTEVFSSEMRSGLQVGLAVLELPSVVILIVYFQ